MDTDITPEVESLGRDYLAKKRQYNVTWDMRNAALEAEHAAGQVLLEARRAFFAAGGTAELLDELIGKEG